MLGFSDDCDTAVRSFPPVNLDNSLFQEYSASRMSLFFSNKVLRLLLSATVSIWMAGGCLFGCSGAVAAEAESSTITVVEGAESCHTQQSHDCCHAAKPKKQRVASSRRQPERLASLVPSPRGMMNDCPLVVNSTAATVKQNAHVPNPGRVAVAALPNFERQTEGSDNTVSSPFLPNRGPTHLLLCVFLI